MICAFGLKSLKVQNFIKIRMPEAILAVSMLHTFIESVAEEYGVKLKYTEQ